MNKKGQFFLIMAVILIVIIAGFITVANYSRRQTYIRIDDLGDELDIEGSKVMDYIANTRDDKLENFTKEYTDYLETAEVYFVTGEEGSIEAYKYENGVKQSVSVEEDTVNEKIKLTVEEDPYEFELNEGEHFYFIIYQYIEGDEYVVTN